MDAPLRRRPGRRGRTARAAAAALAAAVEAGAVAEADSRDLGKQRLAYGSTGDWLTHLGGLRKGEGRRVVARAHALTGPLAAHPGSHGRRPGLTRAVRRDRQVGRRPAVGDRGPCPRRGRRSCSMRGASTPPTSPGPDVTWSHVVDPDAEDRKLERQLDREERASHHTRFLTIVGDGAGGVRLKGRGSAEDGALLKAALMPLTTPAPDPRPRRATTGDGPGPRPARCRCPDVGRPGRHRSARVGHRPATRLSRRTHPTHRHHHPGVTAPRPRAQAADAARDQ